MRQSLSQSAEIDASDADINTGGDLVCVLIATPVGPSSELLP
jgi:hypothetical protein